MVRVGWLGNWTPVPHCGVQVVSLIHGYLVGNPSKCVRDGAVLADHQIIERPTPYGVIRFDRKVWLKVDFLHGTMVICDSSLHQHTIPVGEQLTTP